MLREILHEVEMLKKKRSNVTSGAVTCGGHVHWAVRCKTLALSPIPAAAPPQEQRANDNFSGGCEGGVRPGKVSTEISGRVAPT